MQENFHWRMEVMCLRHFTLRNIACFISLPSAEEARYLQSVHYSLSFLGLLLCMAKGFIGDVQLLLQILYHPKKLLHLSILACTRELSQ